MKWREVNDLFGNTGSVFGSVEEYATAVEEAFGWRPIIQDNGLIRVYTKFNDDGTKGDVFEGERGFVYSEWLNRPNWFKLLEPIEDGE